MAETQLAGTGHRSQFWIDTDAGVLTRLMHVKAITLPTAEREEVETTHLDSNAKEYAPGLVDYGSFEVTLNFRPGSDTDLLLEDMEGDASSRDFLANIAIRGVLTRSYSGVAILTGYDRGEVTADGVMEATATFRISGALTSAVYVAPV